MTTRDQDYYTNMRVAARKIWEGINTLKGEGQAQWNALNYASTLPDGEGTSAGITKTELGSVVFDTADALQVVLNAGSATNLAEVL